MIVVHVNLNSAVTRRVTELGRIHITNDGTGSWEIGHYDGKSFRGRRAEALDRQIVQRRGRVTGFRRNDRHVWSLVAAMLKEMGYG